MKLLLLVLCAVGTCLAFPGEIHVPLTFEEFVQESAQGQNWAFLVAGSNTWGNYRHQADVCHAYQILKAHGMPDERIVVMMYDDLAHNQENPTPGKVINHPNGPDVYHGVPKDYTGKDVTPENFLKIMQGQDMSGIGSGKVIKSGPNDHVFINFVDHGAPGLIGFPEGMVLHASQLIEALTNMHKENKYKQLVFYLEACESGSMFAKLPKDINIYATSAANSHESSYACYRDDALKTFLGDVYSIKWMEDSDKENLNKESLHKQYEIVKKETNTSHVTQFGTMEIAKEKVAAFLGTKKTTPIHYAPAPCLPTASPDTKLAVLYSQLDNAKTANTQNLILSSIKNTLKVRARIEGTMKSIVALVTRDSKETNRMVSIQHDMNNNQCYEPLVDLFRQKCYSFGQYEYALRQLYVLVNLCEEGIHQATIRSAIDTICDGTH